MNLISSIYFIAPLTLIIGVIFGFILRKMYAESHRKNIKAQARQIVENAIVEAEQLKKEALLHNKEEA